MALSTTLLAGDAFAMPQTLIQPDSTALPGRRLRQSACWAVAVCAGLIVATAVVYGQTLRFEFLHYDDNFFVFNEPHVSQGFTPSGIAWTFTSGPLGEWYPLAMLSHMLDCQLFGLNPAGHHLTSVILHAATAVGLFLVLWRMTAGLWPSALVAAIFAIHPQHVESVAWIAERRDVLSGLFFVLILAAYDGYVRRPQSLLRYSLVAALLALGLMAKGMLVTVPALLLLLDYWPLRRFEQARSIGGGDDNSIPAASSRRLVLEKIPLLAIAAAAAAITMITHSSRPDALTMAERLANAAMSYVIYLGQYFVPMGLTIYYSHPEAGWPLWQVVTAIAVLVCITTAAVVWRQSLPYLLVGWFWYLGMLVPVLGIAYVADHARADRYTYLPQIGLSLALVWGAARLVGPSPARRWVLGVVSAMALMALAACAWRQTTFWHDDLTLWRRSAECNPGNPVAYLMLGDSLDGKDDDAAIAQYRQSVAVGPNDWKLYRWARAKAYIALAGIEARRNNRDDALADFRRSLEMDPGLAASHMALGVFFAQQGDLTEAASEFQLCRELDPGLTAASWANLAQAQVQQKMLDEAIVNFRKATEADSNFLMAQLNLALLLADRGDTDEAIAHFRKTIRLDPDLAMAYYRLAQLLRSQGKASEAATIEERGVQASRRYAEKQNRRGLELARQGKLDEAISQFQIAIAVIPDFVEAYQNLGDALARRGRLEQAREAYLRALEINPNYQPARRALAAFPNR